MQARRRLGGLCPGVLAENPTAKGGSVAGRRASRRAPVLTVELPEAHMLNLSKILVPVDFSKSSTAAAEHAAALANRFDSRLVFVHVMPATPSSAAGVSARYYTAATWVSEPEMEERLRKEMQSLAARVSADRPIQTLLLKGEPAENIEAVVRDEQVDLVVIPTHGYGPFRRFLLGSVTAKILHDLSCPVFTGTHVPEISPYKKEPYQRVACALDLEEHSENVLRWAWDFAQAWHALLVAIHAAPLPKVNLAYGEFMVAEPDRLKDSARGALDSLIKKVGCQATVRLDSADPLPYVSKTAGEVLADVLVIGRSAEHGLLERLRTHAYALIRESPCPVISV